jgi:phosphoribosylanthranilate isomerase
MAVRDVKICCIRTPAEVEMALDAGATSLGFVARMPSGPGILDDATIAELVAPIPKTVSCFLLTSRTEIAAIEAHVRETGVNAVQLCAPVAVEILQPLRRRISEIRMVQVVHVTGPESAIRAREVAPYVDSILLDSGAPAGTPGGGPPQLGGTGRVHDWRLSRQIRNEAGRSVFLAGGLDPTNVAAAITAVRPHGVDVCSGLRESGHLVRAKLHAFLAAIRAVDPPA